MGNSNSSLNPFSVGNNNSVRRAIASTGVVNPGGSAPADFTESKPKTNFFSLTAQEMLAQAIGVYNNFDPTRPRMRPEQYADARAVSINPETTDVAAKRATGRSDTSVTANMPEVNGKRKTAEPGGVSSTKDIRDPNGIFGTGNSDSSRPFGGQWSNYKNYTNYWSDKGGYVNETGDYVDKNVMFKIHDRPADASVDKKTWEGVSEKLGFLFKDDEGSKMMSDAIKYSQEKLGASENTKGLTNDAWSLSFVAANEISKEALNGKVGEMLKFDNDFKSKYSGFRANETEGRLYDMMNGITQNYLNQAVQAEGLDRAHVDQNLQALGHDPKTLATFNYRAALESSKNLDLIKDADAFAAKVKDHYDQHGFLPKFNVSMDYLMKRGGDTMAFANADTGLEQAQQSALKGFGKDTNFSTDPNKANELYFAVSGEKETEALTQALSQAFEKAGLNMGDAVKTYGDSEATRLADQTGSLSQTNMTIHMHGGEDGTGLNESGLSAISGNATAAQKAEMDRTKLDLGGQDRNIMESLAKLSAENGGDRMVFNANSCHGNRHAEKARDAYAQGLAAYDRENGTKSETELVTRGVDTFGVADAQGMGDKNGYFTYKYDATGGKNLEYVFSGDRQAEGVGPTFNTTKHYDGSGSYNNNQDYQSHARDAFYESTGSQTTEMNEYLDSQSAKAEQDKAKEDPNKPQEQQQQTATA